MAEIDTSKRKPRRTVGTPSYSYRNKFALAVIAGGCAVFGLLFLIPPFRLGNQKLVEYISKPDIEFEERKALFGFSTAKRGEDISKLLEESENDDKRI